MKSSLTIARNTGDSHPLGFAQLRKEGIEISQALSGSGWTDYNYHDPGVTILEQLCFALTDLIYRSNFDVADYLCDTRGNIDMQALGLHAPEDVLFCRPSTMLDYQKALADMSHDINDVRITSDAGPGGMGGYGLYRVQVRSSAQYGDDAPDSRDLARQTTRNFYKTRNLCEDLECAVSVAEDIDCKLMAEISVKPGFRIAHILAELFYLAAREMDKGVTYKSYSAGLEDGLPLDALFEGPFTRNGLIENNAFATAGEDQDLRLLESAILAAARKIEGVDYIAALRLRPVSDVEDGAGERRYRLSIPEQSKELREIRTLTAGRPVTFAVTEFKAQFEMLRFSGRTKAYRLNEDRMLSEAPTGTYRDLGRYQSVQNQFPAAYGINRFGVQEGDAPERQAQALQLKAYLLLFEQIMSNYLANLGSIRQLFSVRIKEGSTYFKGILQDDEIGDLAAVYPENAEQVLDDILGKLDDFVGRKGRLLDYLLALYGEEFNQEHLRGLNYYYTDEEMRRAIILNKIRLLNRVKHASGDRAAAVNIVAFGEEKTGTDTDGFEEGRVSGLQYRSSIFLGFKELAPRSLVAEVFRHGLRISDEQGDAAGADKERTVSYLWRAKSLFAIEPEPSDDNERRYYQFVRRSSAAYGPLKDGALTGEVLRSGISSENYIYKDGKLCLALNAEVTDDTLHDSEIELMSVGEDEVQEKSRFLRRLLIHLSKECEGMHVLEHILLRPQDFAEHRPEIKERYANRVSVFLPGWTARSYDPQFRSLAEDIIRENCPAHIHVQVYWLGFAEMCEYEVLQHEWTQLLAGNARFENPEELDRASRALLRFIELCNSGVLDLQEGTLESAQLKQRIADRVSHHLELLKFRRRDLQFSQRREEDPELQYLMGIEDLQTEMESFQFYLINHMQLLESVDEVGPSDWGFYLGQSSVILPKPEAFCAGSTHKKHFQVIKTLVENEITVTIGAANSTVFHWLIPEDFAVLKNAHENRSKPDGLQELRARLLELQSHSSVTSRAQGWQRVLGEQR